MVFSSFTFLWVFLPTVLILYYLSKNIFYRNLLLCVVSFLFYAWGEPVYVLLMILSTAFNFVVGIQVADRRTSPLGAKILGLGILINLLALGYFKYLGFFIENLNALLGLSLSAKPVALPIGISFYTFHCISYIVDVYKGKTDAQRDPLKMGLYIAFFPQLVAGPIVKYHDINLQLDHRVSSWKKFNHGAKRFFQGLGKKVLIANVLGKMADHAFAVPTENLSAVMAVAGIFSYTFQLYFDFSGYSDMAIGLARMFGFRFNENFRKPYSSLSIKEFWRKWHISLSTWFRDYLYIPLGGNRVSVSRQYFNLIFVFFATGLWHGASWNFIFWGLWHGLFLFIERLVDVEKTLKFKTLQRVYVMSVVAIGWVFFRANDFTHGGAYLRALVSKTFLTPLDMIRLTNKEFLFFSVLAVALSGLVEMPKSGLWVKTKKKLRRGAGGFFYFLLPLLVILYLAGNTHNPFIYFRF